MNQRIRELAEQAAAEQAKAEEGLDTQRGSGYTNVVPISKGKSEVS